MTGCGTPAGSFKPGPSTDPSGWVTTLSPGSTANGAAPSVKLTGSLVRFVISSCWNPDTRTQGTLRWSGSMATANGVVPMAVAQSDSWGGAVVGGSVVVLLEPGPVSLVTISSGRSPVQATKRAAAATRNGSRRIDTRG